MKVIEFFFGSDWMSKKKRLYRSCYFCGVINTVMVQVDRIDNIFYCLGCKREEAKMERIETMISKFWKKENKRLEKLYESG